MKKILVFLLALVMIFALAACGDEKEADVIAGSDAKDTVIETPSAAPQQPIISDSTPTTTPSPQDYQPVDTLPTNAPVSDPGTGSAIGVTTPTSAPSTGTGTGAGTGTGTAVGVPIPTKDPSTTGTGTGGTGTGGTETGGTTQQPEITFADDSGEMYYPTASDWDKQHGKIGYTTVALANLRVGPGTQYKIYESLRKGAELRIISEEGQWVKVWYDGIILGYIYKDYVAYGTPPAANIAPAPDSGGSAEIIIAP